MEKKKTTMREKLASAVFIGVIGMLFLLNLVVPAPTVLESERRAPAKFPELSMTSVLSGTFMSKFENYAADRFVFRDTFREIQAFIVLDIYRQNDKSRLYRSKNVGVGEFRRTDHTAFRQTTERIKKAADSLADFDMNIYYSVVPDKSIFAERYMPGFDLDAAEAILAEVLSDYEYIPLADKLSANSFYRTDLHWDQTRIADVIARLLSAMDAVPASGERSKLKAGEFHGVYAGQLALPVTADVLTYYDIAGLEVSYLNEKTLQFESGPVYDLERFTGIDPYDIFLRGPQPLIVIENKSVPERELYLFRDSFGSSLAPLLSSAYSKITLIDLRYIHLSLLDQFIDFTPGADALFIYSSQIFNNPSVLQT